MKTALSFLLALNLIIPILLMTFLQLPSTSAQIPRFNNQTDLPLTYKVRIEYKEYQYYASLPPLVLTSTIDATFSAESLVRLGTFGEYVGNATGYYKEIRKNASECGEEGAYNLLLEGNATMDVRINPDLREVSVVITGHNLTHVESYTGCYHDNYRINAQDGEVMTGCNFYDVNLQTGGTYKSDGYVDYKDEDDLQDVGCVMVISTLEDKIDIAVDKPELSPLDSNPKSKVTVTASRVDGSKIPNMKVKIEVCTSIGEASTDGHIHDGRNDPCDAGRPHGGVKYMGGLYLAPFEATTDINGQISLEYDPATQHLLKVGKRSITFKVLYISGEDKIIASKVGDPSIKGEVSITTKVPGLAAMPGSTNCSPQTNYYFVSQGKHECVFYGTQTTNTAVARIAQAFMDKQTECKNNPGGICTMTDASGNNVTFTITGDNKKLRITAMSLPWGGVHDISGDWFAPHATHNNGKMIDIGTADFMTFTTNKTTKKLTVTTTDPDRMKLLWTIISLDSNFNSFAAGEGNPYDPKDDHFHVNFRN